MYRIMVAEDSKPILRDIVRLINDSGFETLIKSTYDGETALEMLEGFEPDIIFTDIKMPVINGLTLIQKAKKRYPGIKCVIISGYADFTFTHEALMLQVDDYVMKPVDKNQFQLLLEKLVKQIDGVQGARDELRLQMILQEGRIISDTGFPENYMLSLIRVGLFQQYAAPLSTDLLHEIMDHVTSARNVWVVNTKLYSEKIIVYDLNNSTYSKIMTQNEIILGELKTRYARVNIICSQKLSDISQLHTQYMGLSNRLGRKVLLDKNGIYEDIEMLGEMAEYIRQKEEIDVFRKKVEMIRKNKSLEGYRKEIRKNVSRWQEKQYTVVVLHKFLMVLLDELFIAVGGRQGAMEEPGTLADKILNGSRRYEELEKCLLDYSEFITGIKDEKPGVSAEMAHQLTDYMQANVYNNLSLQEIADYFEVSPSYICRLFKVYYSDTPISYYGKIKIEEAKKLLHEYRDIRIKDIAEMLGFSDQYYFSKVFKQQYGASPLVYKTQIDRDI